MKAGNNKASSLLIAIPKARNSRTSATPRSWPHLLGLEQTGWFQSRQVECRPSLGSTAYLAYTATLGEDRISGVLAPESGPSGVCSQLVPDLVVQ